MTKINGAEKTKLELQTIKFMYIGAGFLLFDAFYASVTLVMMRELADIFVRLLPFALSYLVAFCAAFFSLRNRVPHLLYPILVADLSIIAISLLVCITYITNILYCKSREYFRGEDVTGIRWDEDVSIVDSIIVCPPPNWLAPLLLRAVGDGCARRPSGIFASSTGVAAIALVVFAQKLMEFAVLRQLMHLFKYGQSIASDIFSSATMKSTESLNANKTPASELTGSLRRKATISAADSDDEMVVYEHVNGHAQIRDNSANLILSKDKRCRDLLPTVKGSKRVIA